MEGLGDSGVVDKPSSEDSKASETQSSGSASSSTSTSSTAAAAAVAASTPNQLGVSPSPPPPPPPGQPENPPLPNEIKPIVFNPSGSSSKSTHITVAAQQSSPWHYDVPKNEKGEEPRFIRQRPPEYNVHSMSTYERHLALKDARGKITAWPDPDRESLESFLERVGYQDRDLEGHSRTEHYDYFHKILNEQPWIKRIAEIGFNAGHSAHALLSLRSPLDKEIKMVSFDIMLHPYSFFSKLYIDYKFPGQHSLVAGDSAASIPTYGELHPNHEPFDLIFIDGDHTFERAFCDIYNMRRFAHKDTIVVIDNVAPHRGVGVQVYYAYRQALDDGIIIHHDHIEVGDYADGFTVCWYKFPDSTHQETAPNYEHMERRIRICELSREMENARTLQELDQIKAEVDALDAQNKDLVDQWARSLYPKMKNKLSNKRTNDYDDRDYSRNRRRRY